MLLTLSCLWRGQDEQETIVQAGVARAVMWQSRRARGRRYSATFKYVCDVIELLHSSFLILQVLDEKETAVYKRALEEQYKLKMKASRCACCPTCLAF